MKSLIFALVVSLTAQPWHFEPVDGRRVALPADEADQLLELAELTHTATTALDLRVKAHDADRLAWSRREAELQDALRDAQPGFFESPILWLTVGCTLGLVAGIGFGIMFSGAR